MTDMCLWVQIRDASTLEILWQFDVVKLIAATLESDIAIPKHYPGRLFQARRGVLIDGSMYWLHWYPLTPRPDYDTQLGIPYNRWNLGIPKSSWDLNTALIPPPRWLP